MGDSWRIRSCYLFPVVYATIQIEVAPADLIVDSTKKEKGQSKTLTFNELSYFFLKTTAKTIAAGTGNRLSH